MILGITNFDSRIRTTRNRRKVLKIECLLLIHVACPDHFLQMRWSPLNSKSFALNHT
jgi:hypothetical protein